MPRCMFLFVVLLLLPAGLSAHPPGDYDRSEAVVLKESTWERVPHGKEVDAIYGDAVLTNAYLTAVVADAKQTRNANMTVHDVGGCLIDLTANGAQSDQLSCFYPDRRKYVYTGREVFSEAASQTVNGKTQGQSSGRVVLVSDGGEGKLLVELIYELRNDNRFLEVTSKYVNRGDKPLTVRLEDEIRADGGKEDMRKASNGTHDLFWFHDTYWGQAYGVEAVGRKIQSESNSRTTVLKYVDGETSSVTIEPGKSFSLVRRVFPGTNLLDVRANWNLSHERAAVPVNFTVIDGRSRPVEGGMIEIERGDESLGLGRTDADGKLDVSLEPGTYAVKVSALGVSLTGDKSLPIEVAANNDDQAFALGFQKWIPGTVDAGITDAAGRPIACKVEFIPKDGTPKPYFGPETAAFGVLNLFYSPHGRFKQPLPEGKYDVIISHGPEYDAIFTELTIAAGESAPLTGQLVRSVDTTGWVSSDFHSHSSPSGDNTASQLGRVLNLLCEHVEFAPCTEHNRISTYVPHIQALGVEADMATVSGMELTGKPLPLNHQNAFPLIMHPHTQDGGAPVPDGDPSTQIERLVLWDNRSDKLVQQNHPDIGWLFYDKNGDGKPDNGYERSLGLIDVMEIHPVQLVLDLKPAVDWDGRPYANRIFAWMQLLNQGYRIPGVVNTDAHYNYHGSGGLRNWIQSGTDNPAEIDVMEMVHASEQGRLVMSNGPFLELSLRETGKSAVAGPGEDLTARSKKLTARVRVQCPNWIDVDRVFLLVNGRPHKVHSYTRKANPDAFRNGAVKFEREMEFEVDGDAHIIAVTGDPNRKLGPVMGPFWGSHHPAALTNPIFVDTDGDGFTPNKDTLGHPLPVKFGQ